MKDSKDNLTDLNTQILDLDWEALYDRNKVLSNSSKRERAAEVKEKVAGFNSKEEMEKYGFDNLKSFGKVGGLSGGSMKEDAIKALWDSKIEMFNAQAKIEEQMKVIEDQMKAAESGS